MSSQIGRNEGFIFLDDFACQANPEPVGVDPLCGGRGAPGGVEKATEFLETVERHRASIDSTDLPRALIERRRHEDL
jgi:hypothetical protein